MSDWYNTQKAKAEQDGNEAKFESSTDKFDSVNIFCSKKNILLNLPLIKHLEQFKYF